MTTKPTGAYRPAHLLRREAENLARYASERRRAARNAIAVATLYPIAVAVWWFGALVVETGEPRAVSVRLAAAGRGWGGVAWTWEVTTGAVWWVLGLVFAAMTGWVVWRRARLSPPDVVVGRAAVPGTTAVLVGLWIAFVPPATDHLFRAMGGYAAGEGPEIVMTLLTLFSLVAVVVLGSGAWKIFHTTRADGSPRARKR